MGSVHCICCMIIEGIWWHWQRPKDIIYSVSLSTLLMYCVLHFCHQTLERMSSQYHVSYIEAKAEYNADKNKFPDKLPSEWDTVNTFLHVESAPESTGHDNICVRSSTSSCHFASIQHMLETGAMHHAVGFCAVFVYGTQCVGVVEVDLHPQHSVGTCILAPLCGLKQLEVVHFQRSVSFLPLNLLFLDVVVNSKLFI